MPVDCSLHSDHELAAEGGVSTSHRVFSTPIFSNIFFRFPSDPGLSAVIISEVGDLRKAMRLKPQHHGDWTAGVQTQTYGICGKFAAPLNHRVSLADLNMKCQKLLILGCFVSLRVA